MRWMVIGAAALALAGCAHGRDQAGAETISYSTQRCFGSCPVYTVTVGPDGQGIFDGQMFTTTRGEQRFQATPEQVRAFAAALAPARPTGDRVIEPGSPGCANAPTDMPSINVRWQGTQGSKSLRFYRGCARENQAIADALAAAPATLPIAGMIGDRSAFSGR